MTPGGAHGVLWPPSPTLSRPCRVGMALAWHTTPPLGHARQPLAMAAARRPSLGPNRVRFGRLYGHPGRQTRGAWPQRTPRAGGPGPPFGVVRALRSATKPPRSFSAEIGLSTRKPHHNNPQNKKQNGRGAGPGPPKPLRTSVLASGGAFQTRGTLSRETEVTRAALGHCVKSLHATGS